MKSSKKLLLLFRNRSSITRQKVKTLETTNFKQNSKKEMLYQFLSQSHSLRSHDFYAHADGIHGPHNKFPRTAFSGRGYLQVSYLMRFTIMSVERPRWFTSQAAR